MILRITRVMEIFIKRDYPLDYIINAINVQDNEDLASQHELPGEVVFDFNKLNTTIELISK